MGQDKTQLEDDWLGSSNEPEKECKEVAELIKRYPPVRKYRKELDDLIKCSMTELRLKYIPKVETNRKSKERAHSQNRKKRHVLRKKQKGADLAGQIAEIERDAPEKHQGNQRKAISQLLAPLLKDFWIGAMGHKNYYYGLTKCHDDDAKEFIDHFVSVVFKSEQSFISKSSFQTLSQPLRPRKN